MSETEEAIQNKFEMAYRTTLKIALLQISAALILMIFGWFYASISDNSVNQKSITILWVVVVSLVITSFILKRFLFSKDRLLKIAGQNNLLTVLQTHTVLLTLIGFIIAILGFLITTLSGNKLESFRAGFAALFVFFINFPRKANWQNLIYQTEKVYSSKSNE